MSDPKRQQRGPGAPSPRDGERKVHQTQIASPFDPPTPEEIRQGAYPIGGGPPSGGFPAVNPKGHAVGGGPPSGGFPAVPPSGGAHWSDPVPDPQSGLGRGRSGLGTVPSGMGTVPSGMGAVPSGGGRGHSGVGGGPPSGAHAAVQPPAHWSDPVPQRPAPQPSGAGPQRPGRGPQPGGQPGIDRHAEKTAVGPASGGGPVPSGLGATATGSDAGQVAGRGLPRIGEVFNGYTVVELLGQGNMGRIYRVRDQLGRDLALKVILGQVASAEGLARFEREGQAMAAIPRHKHVIGVHSAGTAGGLPYLVLDFVEGENLDEVLRRGPLPAAQAALVCEKLSRALDHVHQSGVLHRDLKPANVLIRAVDGEPLLTDFGLAGLQGADTLTRTGDVIGTPLYMAPEQLLGLHKEVDGRADVWSLGVMLFEMAAGALPFPGTTMLEVTDAVLGADPPRLHDRCPDADSGLTRIVNLALAKDKTERLASPGALAAALRTWRKQRQGYDVELDLPPAPGSKARRKWLFPLLAAIATVVIVTLVSVVLSRLSPSPSASLAPASSPTPTATPSAGTLSAAAASAIEAVEAVDRADGGYKDLERAIANPALVGLPHVGRVRLRAIGYTALQKITVELRQPNPRPQVLAGYLRAAGVAQRLSEYDLGGGSNVDGVLTWLESRYPTDPKLVHSAPWVKVFAAIAESGFRPSQRISGKFLDTISLKPTDRQSPSYLKILRALVSVGTPTFYTQFDLKRAKPKKPPREAGDVALYVYYRTLICALDRANASDREKDEVRRELSRLVRTRPQSFDPRTLAMALNVSILPGRDQVQPEIERLEKALRAAPDCFYGWDGLIHLYLDLAEIRAQSRDDAGVRSAYERATDVVARGRRALNIEAGGTRPPTEAIAIKVLLVRQVELLATQDKDTARAATHLGDKDLNDAKRKGQDRRKRIRSWSKGR